MLVFGRDLVTALLAELKPASRERHERMAAKVYRSVVGYLAPPRDAPGYCGAQPFKNVDG
jgi:hypothetical protein